MLVQPWGIKKIPLVVFFARRHDFLMVLRGGRFAGMGEWRNGICQCAGSAYGHGMSATVKKERADLLLVAQGLTESRSMAQRLIGAGQVRIGADHVVAKPNELFPVDTEFRVEAPCPYVSRGAFKLLAGLDAFPLEATGLVVLDVGASTGGFTDLLLQRGARRVYAVDVGTGQLHWKLRQDPRVVC